jgi:hypothetical protein
MEEDEKIKPVEDEEPAASHGGWVWAAIIMIILAGAGFGYALHERAQTSRLAQDYQLMGRTLEDARNQIASLGTQVKKLSSEQSTPAPRPSRAERGVHRTRRAPRRAEDSRWTRMQAELARHQQEIDSTHQEIAQTRADMQGQLSSARDELGGSIARNHDQLVALQKQGQRLFYEYNLEKSKHFQRAGPIGIALRKANTRHQYCDLNLIVDDRIITKKHVNLYEPVVFYPDGYAQALEVVIYQIGKNRASGYVSVPKYSQADLRAGATPEPATPPGAQTPQTPQGSAAASLQHRPAVPVE